MSDFKNFGLVSVNGGWGDTWSDYSECSVSCGEGVEIRTLPCDNPAPEFGGNDCVGNPEESRPCEIKKCPSKFNYK